MAIGHEKNMEPGNGGEIAEDGSISGLPDMPDSTASQNSPNVGGGSETIPGAKENFFPSERPPMPPGKKSGARDPNSTDKRTREEEMIDGFELRGTSNTLTISKPDRSSSLPRPDRLVEDNPQNELDLRGQGGRPSGRKLNNPTHGRQGETPSDIEPANKRSGHGLRKGRGNHMKKQGGFPPPVCPQWRLSSGNRQEGSILPVLNARLNDVTIKRLKGVQGFKDIPAEPGVGSRIPKIPPGHNPFFVKSPGSPKEGEV